MDRRKFLASVAVAGTAGAMPLAATAATQASPGTPPVGQRPSGLPPNVHVAAAETGTAKDLPRIGGVAGSDFMVDVIKTLDIKYLPANPASSFRGLHESLINYGGNEMPEILTCAHEESAVAMGHGYFKVVGKPLMTFCHGTVGMQHASMAIYNAWCDRVPVIVVGSNDLDAAHRPPGVPTIHFPWRAWKTLGILPPKRRCKEDGLTRALTGLQQLLPLCTENLVRFDLTTESLNLGRDGCTDSLPLEPGCLALQVQEPA